MTTPMNDCCATLMQTLHLVIIDCYADDATKGADSLTAAKINFTSLDPSVIHSRQS